MAPCTRMDGDGRFDLGRAGEEAALHRYLDRGYHVLARNWRCPLGELDLVLYHRGTVVVCEVKTRRTRAGSGSRPPLGGPYEAVHAKKRRKLRLLAEAFLSTRDARREQVRFDVASVSVGSGGRTDVHVFEDAF